MEYNCTKCEKNYKSYQSLWNHNKKFHSKISEEENIDKLPLKYKCKICNKKFDNKQNKYYHQKICKNEIILEQPSEKNITTNINNSNNKTINNNINNGTINQNITINNYNNDNLEYISEKFKEKLFNNLLDKSEHYIPLSKLIENIKFNPNHKENNNVKITSDRSKIGFYYDENKWKAINKDALLDDLCDYSFKIFSKYFEEKKEMLPENIHTHFHIFSRVTQIKSELRNKIKDKIENIAYIFTKNNEDELDL